MMTSMTSPSPASSARAQLLFWGLFVGVGAVSLLAFTFTIGNGRLSGPGICLALSTATLVWVGRMLFQSARALVATGSEAEELEQKAASGRRRKELEREYQTLKRALKELELDRAMGKISDDDYQELRGRYRERAVRILRQLDQGESYRAQIDADLKARRDALGLAAPTPVPAAAAESPEPAAAAPASEPEAKPTLSGAASDESLCSACAVRNDSDAVFCKKCGHRLKAA